MISKTKSKFIKSLQIKKYRKQEQCFVVEGEKSVAELLQSDFELVLLAGTPAYLEEMKTLPQEALAEIIEASPAELQGLGEFKTNDTVLAVARMKPNKPFQLGDDEFALALDDIRDPGNLGTIIRTADWYGVNKIVVSEDTADLYNAKVISATMGSFTRVQIYYTDLSQYLDNLQHTVYGTFLEGEDVHHMTFTRGGVIVIGNESHGISAQVERCVTQKITIPRYGHAESLNAGIATAVVLDNLRRR